MNAPGEQDIESGTAAGSRVSLRPAKIEDKLRIFQWHSHSDATARMMGPPLYPELPASTWKEFCEEYGDHYFDGSRPLEGRCFIIVADERDVGVVCHNEVFRDKRSTDLDIWLHSATDFGRGYGPAALIALMRELQDELSLARFIIFTSRRNPHAIAAYLKTGFHEISQEEAAEVIEFTEDDLDYKDGVFLLLESGRGGVTGGCG